MHIIAVKSTQIFESKNYPLFHWSFGGCSERHYHKPTASLANAYCRPACWIFFVFMLYSDWFIQTFVKEILSIALHLSKSTAYFYNIWSLFSYMYLQKLKSFLCRLKITNIYENEKNSMSWLTIRKRMQDWLWVSDD